MPNLPEQTDQINPEDDYAEPIHRCETCGDIFRRPRNPECEAEELECPACYANGQRDAVKELASNRRYMRISGQAGRD